MADNNPSSNAAAIPVTNPAIPVPTAVPGSGVQDGGSATPQVTSVAPGSKDESKLSFGVFDESTQKYLTSQGITENNINTKEAFEKLVSLHKEARASTASAQTPQGVASTLSGIVTGSQPEPAVQPPVVPVAPQQPAQQPVQPQAQSPEATNATGKIPNEVDIFNMTTNLSTQFPALAEDIKSGQFYKDMASRGLTPVTDGNFNLSAILSFAKDRNELAELRSKIDEANKPKPEAVPGVKYSIDESQPKAETMNLNTARAIVMFSNRQLKTGQPVHPQFEEAKTFLQASGKK